MLKLVNNLKTFTNQFNDYTDLFYVKMLLLLL